MRLLFSSMFLYEYSTDMIAKAIDLAEYDGVEFWPETPHFWVDRDMEKLECFLDYEMAVHSPVLDLNPVSVNNDVCDLTLRESLYAVSLAAKMKAWPVTVHAGKRSAAREPVWADYLSLNRYLRILSRYARIKGVDVGLENSENRINNLCRKADEVKKFVDANNIKFTLDIKHALLNGGVNEFIEPLFDKICNIHVSFYDEKGRHVQPSRGETVKEALEKIADLGYSGTVTVELDDLGIGNMDFMKKVEILRKEGHFVEKFFG
ncbi:MULTISPECIES: sugar phosphate isomerase/epimerase family protein [unclassified Archaeoglobus]|jgi:sugar phosphate isomerase/epimerase|uniref:sugar phosphate isomerase/epimerase family protein n=1 Tax=unclassified Archaeoglobus TaxID=2643606 RepID=UPI0025C68BB4|nr:MULTISPECIES: sugar phosphate isomerase/epimerase [unclassified Archaeoglobus]